MRNRKRYGNMRMNGGRSGLKMFGGVCLPVGMEHCPPSCKPKHGGP
jgi:hypothetical protein